MKLWRIKMSAQRWLAGFKSPIVVYQMGKVGSSSVYGSLRRQGVHNVYQAHRLDPENIRRVKAELGVARMDEELKALELRTKELEAAKEKLGVSKYSDSLIPGTEAKRMVTLGASAEKQKITDLESRMDKTMSAIWTATELSEVKPMVDEILAG